MPANYLLTAIACKLASIVPLWQNRRNAFISFLSVICLADLSAATLGPTGLQCRLRRHVSFFHGDFLLTCVLCVICPVCVVTIVAFFARLCNDPFPLQPDSACRRQALLV